jgi:hypothetical protein
MNVLVINVILEDVDYSKLFSGNYIKILAYLNSENFNDIREEKFENSEEIYFVFHELNKSIWQIIKSKSLKKEEVKYQEPYYYYDNNIYKKFLLEYLLIEWNLGIKIEKNNRGRNTNIDTILNVHPSILEYFLVKFDEVSFMSEEYREVICDQCLILFNKNSKGLRNAEQAISDYLDLTIFWDKLGLNYFDLKKLPHDAYESIKLILDKENEIKLKEMEQESKSSQTGSSNSINFTF